jgi:hypothetical protein
MNFYCIEPEVAGGLGEHTVLDTGPHPPVVHRLEYNFAGWMGDSLLESFPCFIGSDTLVEIIVRDHFTGTEIADVEISFSQEYFGRYPKEEIPHFHWLKIIGTAGSDDFGIGPDLRLVISERALNALKVVGIDNAEIEPYQV